MYGSCFNNVIVQPLITKKCGRWTWTLDHRIAQKKKCGRWNWTLDHRLAQKKKCGRWNWTLDQGCLNNFSLLDSFCFFKSLHLKRQVWAFLHHGISMFWISRVGWKVWRQFSNAEHVKPTSRRLQLTPRHCVKCVNHSLRHQGCSRPYKRIHHVCSITASLYEHQILESIRNNCKRAKFKYFVIVWHFSQLHGPIKFRITQKLFIMLVFGSRLHEPIACFGSVNS